MSKKSHRGPIYRCRQCPWEGDKKGVTFHIVMQHRTVEEAPFHCLVCLAKFTTAKPWRRHRATQGHQVRVAMRKAYQGEKGVNLDDCMGQGSRPIRFEGDGADVEQMGKEYSNKFWGLFHHEGLEETDAEQEMDTDGAPAENVAGVETKGQDGQGNDIGQCTPCSVVLEDVVDLDISPSFLDGFPPSQVDEDEGPEKPIREPTQEVPDVEDLEEPPIPSEKSTPAQSVSPKEATLRGNVGEAENTTHVDSEPSVPPLEEEDSAADGVENSDMRADDREGDFDHATASHKSKASAPAPKVAAPAPKVTGTVDVSGPDISESDDEWEPGKCPGASEGYPGRQPSCSV